MTTNERSDDLLLTEEDFLEEIFQEVRDIEESKLNNTFTKIFDFEQERKTWLLKNPELNEFDKSGMRKHLIQNSPNMERFVIFSSKLERLKISTPPLFLKEGTFQIIIIPKLFIDFYNKQNTIPQRNETNPEGGNSDYDKETLLKIQYKVNLGQLIFNNDNVVQLKGKQRDTAECLVESGQDIPVSWDEIFEKFNDSISDQDIPNKFEGDVQKRSVRTAVTEINNHAKLYLKDKDLIGSKDNEYWLQYEVDKGR